MPVVCMAMKREPNRIKTNFWVKLGLGCESKKATSTWPIAASQSHGSQPQKASQCETPHTTPPTQWASVLFYSLGDSGSSWSYTATAHGAQVGSVRLLGT
jgi:hypothetical protein